MIRQRRWLASMLLIAACAPAPRGIVGATAPRNVVVVVIDTLRQDHVSSYGYARATTPNIDDMARQGTLLNAVSPTSWTKSAVASLFTGLHPLRHQAFGYADALSDDADTLAEVLSRAGWSTAAVSSNSWVAERFGMAQGFGTFLHTPENRLRDADAAEVNELVAGLLPKLVEPFFLYVHYIDPHAPYEPRFAWDGSPLPSNRRQRITVEELQMTSSFERPADLLRDALDLYDAEIRQVDDAVGELRKLLTERGLDEHTLWVITSDHGEEFEEHGRTGHGQTVYDESVRIPLIFWGAGARRGKPAETVNLLDIAPTVLELAKTDPSVELDGVSLVSILRGEAGAEKDRESLLHLDFSMGHHLALLRGCNALTLGGEPARKQLFDVCVDRRLDIWSSSSVETRRELADRLAESYNRLSSRGLARRTAALDQNLLNTLGALGYIASPKSIEKQTFFPHRVRPADSDAAGLMGWEDLSQFGRCPDPLSPGNSQFISGWYGPELNGRWATDLGRVALPQLPGRASNLVVRGTSHRPDEFEVTMAIDGKPLLSQRIHQGPYVLQAPVPVSDTDYRVLEVRSSSAFRPADAGAADRRALGIFVEYVCLEPVGTAETAVGTSP